MFFYEGRGFFRPRRSPAWLILYSLLVLVLNELTLSPKFFQVTRLNNDHRSIVVGTMAIA